MAGDKPATAVLVLNKAKVLGQTITVQSDAAYIMLYCSGSPHVAFKIPPNPDGTSTKLTINGGDEPTLFFNDKEQVQQQGKWIQIVSATDSTLSIELGTASFAKVKFENPAETAPPPPPTPTVAAEKTKPLASAELLHSVTPDQLRGFCNGFDQGIRKKCSLCNGTGQVSVRVQTGTQQEGVYSRPVYTDENQPCTRCRGTGFDRSKDQVLILMAGKIVKGLAGLNTEDPKSPQAMTDAYDEITRDMIGDQKTWTLLTANGRSILAQKSPKLDTTVVSLVEVKQSIPHNDHRRYLVRVLGTDKEIYVDNPVLADELKSGHALMGGMVDEPAETGNGEKMTVLKAGFLIAPPINHDWWWWYKDQE